MEHVSKKEKSLADRKSILLTGYFGFGNFGDEVIFAVLKKYFERYGLNVYSLVKHPEKKKEFNRSSIRDIVKAVKLSDIVVNGGGGLLQDKTSAKSLFYYLFVLFIAQRFHKRTICFAQGIGPIKRKISSFALRFILNRTDFITVRDSYSKEVLTKSGVVDRNLNVTSDVAFLFDKEEEISLPLKEFIIYAPGSALSMPDIKTLIDIGKFIRDKSGIPLLLIPFYPARDGNVVMKVSEALDTQIIIPKRIEQYLYIIRKSSFVVGMRYHSLLFSILKSKAFVGLSYDPKVNALMEEVGIKGINNYSKVTLSEFEKVFSYNFSHRVEIERMLEKKIEGFKKRAKENFDIFEKAFIGNADS